MAPIEKKDLKNNSVTLSNKSSLQKNGQKGADGTNAIQIAKETTLSEEDRVLKERIDTCIATLLDSNKDLPPAPLGLELRLKALEIVATELQTATSSMTSVPKPLKFLRPYFQPLKEFSLSLTSPERLGLTLKAKLGDVLAVLAMTLAKPGMIFLFLYLHTDRCLLNRISIKIFDRLCDFYFFMTILLFYDRNT